MEIELKEKYSTTIKTVFSICRRLPCGIYKANPTSDTFLCTNDANSRTVY